jgi:pyruvate/2-oxoacid:ferredoxin oxidoreductase alpha subunit
MANEIGCAVLQPIVLSPFSEEALLDCLKSYSRIITVEVNSTGQFAMLLRSHGIMPDAEVTKYDGRPFTPEDLTDHLKEVGI